MSDQRGVNHRAKRRILTREVDHRAIDQFNRDRPQLDDVLCTGHRRLEIREIHHAQHARPGERRKLQV